MSNIIIEYGKDIIKRSIPASYLHKFKKMGDLKRPDPPIVYNANGEQMYVFYIKSLANAHHPYELTEGRRSEIILWDRFNYGLDTHFYGSEDLFAWQGHPKYSYGMLHESESIIPYVYKEVRKRKDFVKKFNYFFTHTEDLLDSLPNARFLPANGVWYGSAVWGGNMDENPLKNKLVSLVSSTKSISKMHALRKSTALYFLNKGGLVDVMGPIAGKYVDLNDIYEHYCYSIVIENAIEPYYFTEKILNCFAAKTVPVYVGATKICDFFNEDGIICVNEPSMESIVNALKQCSYDDYKNREEAVNDNFVRVKNYLSSEDYICNYYPEILRR